MGGCAMAGNSLTPVPFSRVRVRGGFWGDWIDRVCAATAPACLKACEETRRVDNFRRAAGWQAGGHEGLFYNDSDVYKVLEGVAYALMATPDRSLEAQADGIIDAICAAQQPDGYLYTYFILKTPEHRWTDTDHHEDYCLGHLLEAGIAYFQATGKRRLLDAAVRAVDQMRAVVGPGRRDWVTGHQEIEMALIRYYRLTGEAQYLDFARWLVNQRGHARTELPLSHAKRFFTDEYCQNDLPARQLTRVTGHAVRAMYYYSALADLAALDGDRELYAALLRLWDNVSPANLYLTGGIGQSRHNEGFTRDWSLPNLTAYCETCAAVGMAFWNQRMNAIDGGARYADMVERELYNGILAGISLKGDTFFYENPLASVGAHHRRPWFGTSCCPTNLIRFIPSIGGYAYATRGDELYINQFLASDAEIALASGRARLSVATGYPWDGRLDVEIESDAPMALLVRLPDWCASFSAARDGRPLNIAPQSGYLRFKIEGRARLSIELGMPARRVYADPRVAEDVGRVAVMRGPLVYCAEACDNPGMPDEYFHADFTLPAQAELLPVRERSELGDLVRLIGPGASLIPYYAWDNRAPGAMAVWLKER
ncbi:MAG: glycoside hydrolase family 127 protein [Clostridiales bacterium]|nr:glycoside hydrolase family 127 protein [Clostridiales bacterium]